MPPIHTYSACTIPDWSSERKRACVSSESFVYGGSAVMAVVSPGGPGGAEDGGEPIVTFFPLSYMAIVSPPTFDSLQPIAEEN